MKFGRITFRQRKTERLHYSRGKSWRRTLCGLRIRSRVHLEVELHSPACTEQPLAIQLRDGSTFGVCGTCARSANRRLRDEQRAAAAVREMLTNGDRDR